MEQDKSSEVDRLTSQLETIARQALEMPDGITTKLDYKIDLSANFKLRLMTKDENEAASYKGAGHTTAVFIARTTGLPDEDDGGFRVEYSALYSHEEQLLRGVQFMAPLEIPPIPLQATDLEKIAFQKITALARTSYDTALLRDELWKGTFSLSLSEMSQAGGSLLASCLESVNQLLAEGAYYERRFKRLSMPEAMFWLESIVLSGPLEHADSRDLDENLLTVSFTDGSLTHSFDQLRTGVFEIKTEIADEAERYRHYRTFHPTFDPTSGELDGFGIEGTEIAEKQQIERDAGMYLPTVEKLKLFLNRLQSKI